MCAATDDAELAKAWSLRRISIVNAATVTDADDGHNYRHYVPGALRAFARKWRSQPHAVAPVYGEHTCNQACRMFEYVPPGRCSGDVFICCASGDIHICTKDLCRHTEPQHGFPGYNNARRAVCHVCTLTRRVFSVNPDQSASGGGGDEEDELGGGGGGTGAGFDDIQPQGCDGGRVLLEYDSDSGGNAGGNSGEAVALAAVTKEAAVDAPKRGNKKKRHDDKDATGPSSKRKRATASAAAGPSAKATTQRPILHATDCDNRERRIRIYAGVARNLMPAAPTASINAWVHRMEHIWSVIQRSPGFERNNSQLQPRLFALVCLNYMRNIGLKTKTMGGARVVCVLPSVAYVREHMADIKRIGETGFTQAERALMCCMNELPAEEKLRLQCDTDKFLLCSF